jgi:hypothetical protein
MNEVDREATVVGEQLPTEERLRSPDTTLTDRRELVQAPDLEKGDDGSEMIPTK